MRWFAVALLAAPAFGCVKREPMPPVSGYISRNETPVTHTMLLHPSGELLEFQKLRGNVVLLDVWASWCEPCKDALPMYDALQKEYGARGLKVFALNVDEDVSVIDPFMAEQKLTLQVLRLRPGQSPEATLGLKLMPTSFLIDKRGVVRHVHEGFAEEFLQRYQSEIEALLAEKLD